MEKMIPVTKMNCEQLNYFEHKELKNPDGTPLLARRNSKTKIWKKQSERFQISCRYGNNQKIVISNENCHLWNGEE